MNKKVITTVIAGILLTLSLSACSDFGEEYNDAPVKGNNDEPALRISFPDGFGNVARKCDGPNMVYSSRNGDGGRAIGIAPNDPRCVEAEEVKK